MSVFRAYIIPFNEDGTYSDTEIEITQDVDFGSISTVKQQLDQNENKVGVLTFNDLNLKLRNEHGKYSDPTVPESIFSHKRSDSIFILKWQIDSLLPYAGPAIAGTSHVSPIEVIYEGFINDDATRTSVKDHFTSLKVIGLESIVTQIEVPFSTIGATDLFSEVIFDVLNQSEITDLITVSAANITVGYDENMDTKTDLQNKTGKEALDILLLLSNSILYIKDRVLFVTGRTATATSQYIFKGPASILGLPNMQDISDIRTGRSQMFNYWTWANETFTVEDNTTVALYGRKKRELNEEIVTDTTKRQNILGALNTEFGAPKENFRVTVPIDYTTLQLFYLNKVNVDYPTVYIPGEDEDLPIYGVSKYDEAVYPIPESVLTIPVTTDYKIIGVNLKVKAQLIEFKLKEV